MPPSVRTVLLIATLAAVSSPGSAQTDWLKKGGELLGGFGKSATGGTLGEDQIVAGLKEALRVGTETVVDQLGASGGFESDPAIHIPLPESLGTVQKTLSKFGMSGMLDDLEIRLNRAAEEAIPRAKQLFEDAIKDMSVDDARQIYDGPEDAATRYFEKKMTPALQAEMRPIVDSSLADVGAVQAYESAMGEYRKLPFVPDVKANLTNHVLEKGLAGVFHYLAQEEAAIRREPVKRTTEILKQVFGN